MNAMVDVQAMEQTTNPAWIIKPLNSHFESLGEALFSYCNSYGFDDPKQKGFDNETVIAFCHALQIPVLNIDSSDIMRGKHYFKSNQWLVDYLDAEGYQRKGFGYYYKLDDSNRPISLINISPSSAHNFYFTHKGAESISRTLRELIELNLHTDPEQKKKDTFYEVVKSRGMMGEGLTLTEESIDNARTALEEYYPYLEGGVLSLMQAFMESEESVLVCYGPPGTGKSSAIAAAVAALNLLPIYAKKMDVITDKNFIATVFKASDGYMEKVGGTAAKARQELYDKESAFDFEFKPAQKIAEDADAVKPVARIPAIVVEDADIILAPRTTGNLMMSELLNETDGVGSNHTRKIIFNTNLTDLRLIDEALLRAGRCYEAVNFRLLTPSEAIAARKANGLPDFVEEPTTNISLAEALRKPRKRIVLSAPKAKTGFGG